MGWAGPAQPTGPDSAPNVLGRFRPKMYWADLGPKKLLSSSGPDPAQKTGLGQDPPGPAIKTGGGNYFPPTPACRTLFVLHAEKKRKINAGNEGEEELPGAEEVVALVLLLLLEAVLVLVLLEVEAVDSRTAAVALLLVAEREVLPPPLSSVSFPFRFLPFLLLLWFSFPLFSFLSVLPSSSPLSLSFGFFVLLPSPLFFSVFFPPVYSLLLLSLLLCCLLFIEPSEWLFVVEHGEQPAGRPLGATAKARPPSSVFWQVRGGWSAIVSGRWAPGERVAGKNSKKSFPFSFFPAACSGGRRKMNSVVQNDTVLLFFFFCMKQRRFGENAPFHLNMAPERAKFQISPQSSFFSSIASLPISVSAPFVGRVSHFSHWPLIYAIEPLIDQKTSNFFN